MSKHSALNTFGRSANPAFTRGFESNTHSLPLSEQMTLDGAVNKTGILLSLCFTGAIIGWNIPSLILPAAIAGFILAMVTIFRSKEKAVNRWSLRIAHHHMESAFQTKSCQGKLSKDALQGKGPFFNNVGQTLPLSEPRPTYLPRSRQRS